MLSYTSSVQRLKEFSFFLSSSKLTRVACPFPNVRDMYVECQGESERVAQEEIDDDSSFSSPGVWRLASIPI